MSGLTERSEVSYVAITCRGAAANAVPAKSSLSGADGLKRMLLLDAPVWAAPRGRQPNAFGCMRMNLNVNHLMFDV